MRLFALQGQTLFAPRFRSAQPWAHAHNPAPPRGVGDAAPYNTIRRASRYRKRPRRPGGRPPYIPLYHIPWGGPSPATYSRQPVGAGHARPAARTASTRFSVHLRAAYMRPLHARRRGRGCRTEGSRSGQDRSLHGTRERRSVGRCGVVSVGPRLSVAKPGSEQCLPLRGKQPHERASFAGWRRSLCAAKRS